MKRDTALKSRIVIVGAGQAGGRTAQSLRRHGHTGTITLLGDERTPPYERPPLSKGILLGSDNAASLLLLAEATWLTIDVDLHCSSPVFSIDTVAQCVVLLNGRCVEYDVLVVATGAKARRFPGKVIPGTETLYLRTLDDAERLRPRLAPGKHIGIIGAGFVGMELASSARQLGADVTLIEAAARPLARLLPAAFSARLMEMHQTSGVQVLLNAAVESLSPGRVSLVDGREIYVDTIVIGIGAQPNDEIASDAGLHVRDGIVVDTQGRSSNAAIYAVGDVARHVNLEFGLDYRLESWRNAEDGALAAAAAICSMPAPARRAPWFWTDQYGHNIQLAGKPIDAHERIERGDPTTGPSISYYLESGIVRGAIAVDCARELRNSMNLIEGGKVVDPAALVGPRLRMPSTVFTPPEVIP